MIIGTNEFRGMNAYMDEELVPKGVAVFCSNLDTASGAFQPLRGIAAGPRGSAVVAASTKTIFYLGTWRGLTESSCVFRHPDTDRIIWASAAHEPRQATSAHLTASTFRRLGVPAPSVAPTVVVSGACGEALLRSTSYVYTLVTDMGEESGFSPPSDVFDVYEGQTATISAFTKTVPANTTLANIRIYRAETDDYGQALFQLVGEIAAAATSFSDNTDETDEAGITRKWVHPPTSMHAMTVMQNGMIAGIQTSSGDNREVCLSEPGYPYAFPQANRVRVPHPAVNIASVGSSVVVLTDERPVMVYASSPEAVTVTPLSKSVAPLSSIPRAVAVSQFGVTFPSHDGLVNVTESGVVDNVTEKILTRKQWAEFTPANILTAVHNDKVYLFATDAGLTKQGAVYDTASGNFCALSGVAHAVYDVYVDYAVDAMYLLYINNGDTSRRIGQFDADAGDYMTGTWKSGVVRLPRYSSFPAMEIAGSFSGGRTVTVKVYRDGVLFHTKTISAGGTYRLPPGLYQTIQFELSGTARVNSIYFAESAEELRDV